MIMRGKKRFLKTLLALSLALFLGVPNVQVVYASESGEEATSDILSTPLFDKLRSKHKTFFKTDLYNGDVFSTIRFNLVPVIKDLATGTALNDKFTWEFEDAPLYFEHQDAKKAKMAAKNHFCYLQPKFLRSLLGEAVIGVYNLRRLEYKMKTREVDDGNGGTIYRCAIVGVSVKSWCSPYGDVCTREEAIGYYNQCQEQISYIVSEIIAARQPNGEPLTDEQKLKMVHDWLIANADYARKKLKLHESNSEKYKFNHLWNEYGAIMDGEAVCRGYTFAFKAIVDELVKQTGADIECKEATGDNHSWIQVKLGDEWYNIDTTWDESNSSSDFISDKYFLV